MKSKNPGYYKAINASVQYEAERGRPGVPKVNLGLMKYLSEARGSDAVGGCLAADEISGTHLPASELKQAHDSGVWIDFTGEWYATDEKLTK